MKKVFIVLLLLGVAGGGLTPAQATAEDPAPVNNDMPQSSFDLILPPERVEEAPPPPPPPPEEPQADKDYLAMVQESYAMPADFDFAKARDLYTQVTFYTPYLVSPQKDFEEFVERLRAQDSTVVKEVQAYMYQHFALPEAQMRAARFFHMARLPKAATYHNWAAQGLSKAMMATGNGRSAETAYKIVIMAEEYQMVARWGETVSQRKVSQGGRVYDVLKIRDPETFEEKEVWFDVTALTEARRKQAQEAAAP